MTFNLPITIEQYQQITPVINLTVNKTGKQISYYTVITSYSIHYTKLYDHSAVCMEKTGDITNAKAFLNALIATYPDDKIAREAQKRLDKLQ